MVCAGVALLAVSAAVTLPIPPRMVQAVLSIEDRRFYEHPGIDPIGIGGALFSYATRRRTYVAGGSTITQQLVRNVFLPKFQGMTLQTARARSVRRSVTVALTSSVVIRLSPPTSARMRRTFLMSASLKSREIF